MSDLEDESEEEEEEDKAKNKKEKSKSWDKETKRQRMIRYKKYEKMSETLEPDKQGVRHQAAAMYKLIMAHEKTVEHLRSLIYQDTNEEQMQENKDMI